jgi:DNA-binding PadR family transcriptional regulator
MADEVREPTFLVLTALAKGPCHGYGIIQEVELLSEGATRLKAGTLYAALDRLERGGLIEIESEEIVAGRLRRYYRLTPSGFGVLAEESRRRLAVSTEAIRRIRLAGGLT